jgi:hypothetical protein
MPRGTRSDTACARWHKPGGSGSKRGQWQSVRARVLSGGGEGGGAVAERASVGVVGRSAGGAVAERASEGVVRRSAGGAVAHRASVDAVSRSRWGRWRSVRAWTLSLEVWAVAQRASEDVVGRRGRGGVAQRASVDVVRRRGGGSGRACERGRCNAEGKGGEGRSTWATGATYRQHRVVSRPPGSGGAERAAAQRGGCG